jgi:ankyrin repeat domain-containing protein 50
VIFFLIQSDDQESLDARTVIRSLIRQRLPEAAQISDEIHDQLRRLDAHSESEAFLSLFDKIGSPSKTCYIIIDGLDECDDRNRVEILNSLETLTARSRTTKVFIASRESLAGEIARHFPDYEHVSMDNVIAQSDIPVYISGIVQKRVEDGELKVGDDMIITEIKEALIKGADGM